MINKSLFAKEKFYLVSSTGKRFELTKTSLPQVDPQMCINCGQCLRLCPTLAITQRQREICRICPDCSNSVQLPSQITEAARKSCGSSCPINMVPQSYINLIAEGRFDEAFRLVKQHTPLPAICGYICHHPCEEECKRGGIDEPVAIRALKRFVADRELKDEDELAKIGPIPKRWDEKVAIIGSGPAGLTAAYDLVRWGYGVTIFEALPFAGGMLKIGIPAFRLPRKILQAEIDFIFNLGVEIRYNTPIGQEPTLNDLFIQGYEAIFIAIGAHRSQRLGIAGEDLIGVLEAISFMRDVNMGRFDKKIGKSVVVIGGGSVAMDVARSALRLGPDEVRIACLEERGTMPAHNWEIEEAEYEGVEFHFSVSPTEILGKDGRVKGIKFRGDSDLVLDVDTVIVAIGQSPDVSVLGDNGLNRTELGTFDVHPLTLATNRPGIFAGGDAVNVKACAIEAMATGKGAAKSIDDYLRKRCLTEEYLTKPIEPAPIEEKIYPEQIERIKRNKMPTLSLEERLGSFDVVDLGFDEEMAVEEARRCLRCGYCSIDQERCIGCGICRHNCPQQNVITMEALATTRGK